MLKAVFVWVKRDVLQEKKLKKLLKQLKNVELFINFLILMEKIFHYLFVIVNGIHVWL